MTTARVKYLAAVKRLAAVETSRKASNQHELNGSGALRELLGAESVKSQPATWLRLSDEGDPLLEQTMYSWYDSRRDDDTRSAEWRLYYTGDPPIQEGDLLVCLKRKGDSQLALIVAPLGSTWETQLIAMFGEPDPRAGTFSIVQIETVPPLFAEVAYQLFAALGWNERTVEPQPKDLELVLAKFGGSFPQTREFSLFARSLVETSTEDPDGTLLLWWRREEALFRALEEHGLSARLASARPFKGVDDFIACSLSVQNRRKSRAGHALENHVAALLDLKRLRYERNPVTEGARRPDFILPGAREYQDDKFPLGLLTTLAAKTTCKDRWRQVLNEAAKLPTKHLLTLEPAISTQQLSEMHEEGVRLIVPQEMLSTYKPPSGMALLTVGEFLEEAQGRQDRMPR